MSFKPTKIAPLFFSAVILAACSGYPNVQIEKEMPNFVGKDLSYAIKYLGYPDRKDSFNGHTVYIWENSGVETGSRLVSTPVKSVSSIGTSTMYTTTYQNSVVSTTHSYSCKIRLIADSKDRIIDTDLDNEGCDKVERRISVVKKIDMDKAKAAEEAAKNKAELAEKKK